MSHQAQTWAIEQTAGNPGAKALLMALANAADVCGVTFVGRAELARQLEVRPGTVTDNMVRLEKAGLVAREGRRRRNGSRTTDWIVLAPRGKERGDMRDASSDEYPASIADLASKSVSDPDQGGSGPIDPRVQSRFRGGPYPLEEPGEKTTPTATSSLNARANGERPKIGGKPVNVEAWAMTSEALNAYNRMAGSDLQLLTGRGQPSEAAKRIYGRLRDYPVTWHDDERRPTVAKLERIIRNTLASRWWGDGPPSIGVVFGPRVFEENITRRPEPERRGNGKQSAGDIIRELMTAKEEANSGDVA